MAELTQLRLPHEDEFTWWALDRVVDRNLGCSNCNRKIEAGVPHARGERGQRLCEGCVASAWKGATMSATEANRNQRRLRRAHSEARGERMVRMLLDGLEVGSIRELKALVDEARPTAERRHMVDRAGTQSAAIGMARLALKQGDPEKAGRVLDDAVEKIHRQHFDACIEDGYPQETVELLLGPREIGANDGA